MVNFQRPLLSTPDAGVWLLQVHLCGSFTRWVETVPMAAVDGSPGVYSVVVHLPPGCASTLAESLLNQAT